MNTVFKVFGTTQQMCFVFSWISIMYWLEFRLKLMIAVYLLGAQCERDSVEKKLRVSFCAI